jgi:hypothetical protein
MRIFVVFFSGAVLAAGAMGSAARGAEGIEVRAVVEPREISEVAPERSASVLVALQITNVGGRPILVDKFETPAVELTGPDGARAATKSGRYVTFYPKNWDVSQIDERKDFCGVAPHASTYIPMECAVGFNTEGPFADGRLYFSYQGRDGSLYQIGPLKKGAYGLVLRYTVDKIDSVFFDQAHPWKEGPWRGTIRTKPVAFVIRSG